MGVHPKVVQDIFGHAEISMTLDTYSHVMPTMQEEAMERLNEMFKDETVKKSEDDNNNEDGDAVVAVR